MISEATRATPVAGSRRRTLARQHQIGSVIVFAILVVAAVFFIFPLFWILTIAFKTRLEIFSIPPVWIFTPTLKHFANIFGIQTQQGALSTGGNSYAVNIPRYFMNSVIVSVVSVLLSLIIGCPAAYAFAQNRFRFDNFLLFGLLFLRLLPPIVTILPLFVIMKYLDLLDTRTALILAYITFNVPFVVWVMRGFYLDLPRELQDAALIDGSTLFGAFWHIAIPLSRPGLVAASIFALLLSWNDYLFAAILTGPSSQTLPVMVAGFTSDVGTAWGEMAASGVIIILPVLLFILFVQRHLVSGLTSGAIKG